jgi:hypothetical protein
MPGPASPRAPQGLTTRALPPLARPVSAKCDAVASRWRGCAAISSKCRWRAAGRFVGVRRLSRR